MSLDLARAGPLACIVGKQQLEAMALPQPRRVGRRRHEARATEVEIALARSFLGGVKGSQSAPIGPLPLRPISLAISLASASRSRGAPPGSSSLDGQTLTIDVAVFVIALKHEDGKLTSGRLYAEKDGVKPPM